jgi:tRNA-dihydrouridine synthase B
MNFTNKILLAPMAGIAEPVFRALCRRGGADAVVSEMVSADGLRHGSAATKELLRCGPAERPFGIQLFGADAARLAWAAATVEELAQPDFIDLNSGCPVRKVVRRNGGAALLKDPALFRAIVGAMVKAVRTPLTVKIRSAWSGDAWVDVEYARIAEGEGAAAVILHPRTAAMGYSGHSFWERIALVKQAVSIPVIGNGDIVRPADAPAMMRQTGCDSLMIGRGSYGNPWLFGQCRAALEGREPDTVTPHQRLDAAGEHLEGYLAAYGPARAACDMKKHLAWYVRGMPGVAGVRNRIFRAASVSELRSLLDELGTSAQAPADRS